MTSYVKINLSQFYDGLFIFVFRQCLAVPAVLIFHKRHALAFYGFSNDHHGLFCSCNAAECFLNLADVVSVNNDWLPAECLGFLFKIFQIMAMHGLAALAQPIDINDAD